MCLLCNRPPMGLKHLVVKPAPGLSIVLVWSGVVAVVGCRGGQQGCLIPVSHCHCKCGACKLTCCHGSAGWPSGGDLTHMAHIVICPGVKKHHERNPDMVERIKKKAFQMDREVIS